MGIARLFLYFIALNMALSVPCAFVFFILAFSYEKAEEAVDRYFERRVARRGYRLGDAHRTDRLSHKRAAGTRKTTSTMRKKK